MDSIQAIEFAIDDMLERESDDADTIECISALRALRSNLLAMLGRLDPLSVVFEREHARDERREPESTPA